METISANLELLISTKAGLKSAINDLGGAITDATPFSQYSEHLSGAVGTSGFFISVPAGEELYADFYSGNTLTPQPSALGECTLRVKGYAYVDCFYGKISIDGGTVRAESFGGNSITVRNGVCHANDDDGVYNSGGTVDVTILSGGTVSDSIFGDSAKMRCMNLVMESGSLLYTSDPYYHYYSGFSSAPVCGTVRTDFFCARNSVSFGEGGRLEAYNNLDGGTFTFGPGSYGRIYGLNNYFYEDNHYPNLICINIAGGTVTGYHNGEEDGFSGSSGKTGYTTNMDDDVCDPYDGGNITAGTGTRISGRYARVNLSGGYAKVYLYNMRLTVTGGTADIQNMYYEGSLIVRGGTVTFFETMGNTSFRRDVRYELDLSCVSTVNCTAYDTVYWHFSNAPETVSSMRKVLSVKPGSTCYFSSVTGNVYRALTNTAHAVYTDESTGEVTFSPVPDNRPCLVRKGGGINAGEGEIFLTSLEYLTTLGEEYAEYTSWVLYDDETAE